jgi:hypothetical protein
MSGHLANIPRERFEELAFAPIRLAQAEAVRMLQADDLAGAESRIAEGVAQSTAIRAQLHAQQQAAAPAVVPPTAPAGPIAPTAPTAPASPLAAPGTPMHAYVALPIEQAPDESLGMFYLRRGGAIRQATAAAPDGRFELTRPFGLRPRR